MRLIVIEFSSARGVWVGREVIEVGLCLLFPIAVSAGDRVAQLALHIARRGGDHPVHPVGHDRINAVGRALDRGDAGFFERL